MTKRGRILTISDDPQLAKLLEHGMAGRGYELASTRATSRDFERLLDEMEPDLIVVDIQMPSLSGIELSLRIRRKSTVPILMLSTWGAREDGVRYLDLSDETYLTEPVTTEELVEHIEEIIRQN